MSILYNIEPTYLVNITELSKNDTVNCKINTLDLDHKNEWIAIDRIKEIINKGIKIDEDVTEVTQAYNEIVFKGKEPGFNCEVTIPELNTTINKNGKKLDVDSVCRDIKSNDQMIDEICKRIIKESFNIESFEIVNSNLNEADKDVSLDRLMSIAEFRSDTRRIGLLWRRNKIDENGYTMTFQAVIE